MADDPWALFGEDTGTKAQQPTAPLGNGGAALGSGAGGFGVPQGYAEEQPSEPAGFYCSTSGTYFPDKESLQEHYRSDFHRYNLKRRAANLPPVSREWFEERKAQLVQASATSSQAARVWVCSLTGKRFASAKTYETWTRSKKYRELLKGAGHEKDPGPEVREVKPGAAGRGPGQQAPAGGGFDVSAAKRAAGAVVASVGAGEDSDDDDDDDGSGWETASDDGVPGPGGAGDPAVQAEGAAESALDWDQEWDATRCLFCNRDAPEFEDNMGHMYSAHGFFVPDSAYLKDPEGLVKYLGLKISVGRYPLYVRGDDPEGKQFRTARAVQQHMVDSSRCYMAYEDNEEEYEEFYDFTLGDESDKALVSVDLGLVHHGFEMTIRDDAASAAKVIGSRDMLRYYRQRVRLPDPRSSAQAAKVVAAYRKLELPTQQMSVEKKTVFAQRQQHKLDRRATDFAVGNKGRGNLVRNLPKDVPY